MTLVRENDEVYNNCCFIYLNCSVACLETTVLQVLFFVKEDCKLPKKIISTCPILHRPHPESFVQTRVTVEGTDEEAVIWLSILQQTIEKYLAQSLIFSLILIKQSSCCLYEYSAL
jgi:hypothetical protein